MRYMMFVATDPEAEPFVAEEDDIGDWVADVDARGVHVFGERLRPVQDATLVRVRGGELLVTDGPFTESKEWIAGFDVLECRDLDEAIEIARRHPMARFGRIELRPMWPFDVEEDPTAREEREAAIAADAPSPRWEPERGPHRMTDPSAAAKAAADAADAVALAYREEWTRIVATLIRATGDWDVAEDATADAFERAARRWETEGVPRTPGAWLTTVAKNRALDVLRRRGVETGKVREWMAMDELTGGGASDDPAELAAAEPEWDDRLRLVFTCAHPALPIEARVALTLRTVAGLDTGEIARAFLVPESTMAQRLVRAKRKIRHAAIPYRVPSADELPERLGGVLAVLMLVHNEGYLASSGDRLLRLDLQEEAIRLARLVVELLPDADEARAVLALLLLQHARSAARVDGDGELVPLDEQDRERWNHSEVAEGLALLASRPSDPGTIGTYRVQAEIQAVHARARRADETDWPAIVGWYDALAAASPSPVIDLNRAVAVGLAGDPGRGLAELDRLEASGRLEGHHLLAAAQADLLRRSGRFDDAAARYRRAIELAPTGPERRFLLRRLAELPGA